MSFLSVDLVDDVTDLYSLIVRFAVGVDLKSR